MNAAGTSRAFLLMAVIGLFAAWHVCPVQSELRDEIRLDPQKAKKGTPAEIEGG